MTPDGGGAPTGADGAGVAQSFYSRWAHPYDLIARRSPGVGRLRRALASALAPARGDVVVEMGCGTGANFRRLRERVGADGTVVGVDFSPGVLERAREQVERAGWRNVRVVRGDAARPPIARADAVCSSFVSGMLADPAAAVERWADLVGPGGRLALLDLASSTRAGGRALNPAFEALVRAGSPPGTAAAHGGDPTRALDARVAAAHQALRERCPDVRTETRLLGFARISGGTVR